MLLTHKLGFIPGNIELTKFYGSSSNPREIVTSSTKLKFAFPSSDGDSVKPNLLFLVVQSD